MSSTKSIVIWGSKGHARVLAEFLPRSGYPIVALFDNDMSAVSVIPQTPLFLGQVGFRTWLNQQSHLSEIRSLIAIGGHHGGVRLELQSLLTGFGIEPLPSAIHPTAFVASDASLGMGTQVLALAAVCASVKTGASCIVNTRSSIDHEGVLGDGVHLAPGATLAGCVTIGDRTLIGPGAIVLPGRKIGCDSIIGAGSVVTKDLPDGVVAYGNPARVIRRNEVASTH